MEDPRRAWAAWTLLRRYPLALGYGLLLVTTTAARAVVAPARMAGFDQYISTNLDNLADHPAQALLLSVTAASPSYQWLFLVLTVGAIGVCEAWLGSWRTLAYYLGANALVTLVVAAWIEGNLAAGRFEDSVRSTLDFGLSYGLNALLFLLIARPTRLWANLALAAAALGWLALEEPWPVTGQDQFSELGHLLASALGLGTAVGILVRRRLRGRRAQPGRPEPILHGAR